VDALTDHEISVRAKPYTLTGATRRAAMLQAMQDIDRRKIKGDVVECGVWRGGNIIIARLKSPDRVCWLYDTFTGMTEPGPEDVNRGGMPAKGRFDAVDPSAGWCMAPLDQVKECLSVAGVYDEAKLRFVVGQVEETLKVDVPHEIALLRLDTDWYSSTKIELDVLYPRLSRGGILIVDDYGHWQGSKKAVDEYFGGRFAPVWIDYSCVMMVKP